MVEHICISTPSVRERFNGLHVWNKRRIRCRMLKKATFSPAQPRRAKTRRSAGKAAAPRLTLVSRLTFHGLWERCENDAGGLFQHPVKHGFWRTV